MTHRLVDGKPVRRPIADAKRLMVEAGPRVAASFLNADLVDEVGLFRARKPLGEGIDALEGMPLTALTQSPRLTSRGIETVGEDTLEWFERR